MDSEQLKLPAVSRLELAIVLAALRTYQEQGAPWTVHYDDVPWTGEGVIDLNDIDGRIDELVMKLNGGPGNDDEAAAVDGDPWWTVMVMQPDSARSKHGDGTYLSSVQAATAGEAERAVQREAVEADGNPHDPECDNNPDDYAVLLCIAGKHVNCHHHDHDGPEGAAAESDGGSLFTVLVMRPDGEDSYLSSVRAASPADAMLAVQQEAAAEDRGDDGDPEGYDPDDYAVLLCIAGEHDDLSPGPYAAPAGPSP